MARTYADVLAVLLMFAVLHKARVLCVGAAKDEPLIRVRAWRGRRASVALAVAAFLEVSTAVALLAEPEIGLWLASALLVFYSIQLQGLTPTQPCHCMGGILDAGTPRRAILRNVILATFALCSGAGEAAGVVPVLPSSEAVLGASLLVLSAVSAQSVLASYRVPLRLPIRR